MILEHEYSELSTLFHELQLPAFRVEQVRHWIFARKCFDYAEMVNISKRHRQILTDRFGSILRAEEIVKSVSQDGTQKLLLRLSDDEKIECVLLRDNRNHRTACVSTQVGCAMGCRFCASGLGGFVRNLTRGEILEQILRLGALLPMTERLTHLVIMGTGEPLLNLSALLSALDDATAANGLDLSVRRVTISTVGIPKGIRELAQAVVQGGKGYKLAVSLHAPNDELRSELIPRNRQHGIQEVFKATDEYFSETGRRVTFEYILIDGLNDKRHHAEELTRLLGQRTAIVNLIPFNPVSELPYRTPPEKHCRQFAEWLKQGGIQVKIRFRKGDDINAACGQLRQKRG